VKSNLILVTVPHVNKVEHALSLQVKISSVPVHQVSLQLPFKLLVYQCVVLCSSLCWKSPEILQSVIKNNRIDPTEQSSIIILAKSL